MFGYIKIDKPELKIGDYEIYRGIYCSLCKEMGRNFGLFARFALSYDLTFLALLKMALTDECTKFKKSRCSFNPLKKCNQCENNKDSLIFSAYMAIILIYYKIMDNIADSGFFKKIAMYMFLPFIKFSYRKARKKYPDLNCKISEFTEKQNELEQSKCSQIDLAAEPTALILTEIIKNCSIDEEQIIILKKLGYFMGRYIYILDAADDIEDDLKSGNYNPFLIEKNPDSIKIDEIKKEAKDIIFRNIAQLIDTYEMLQIKRFKNILDNIIYDGLYKETERIISDRVVI